MIFNSDLLIDSWEMIRPMISEPWRIGALAKLCELFESAGCEDIDAIAHRFPEAPAALRMLRGYESNK